MNQNSPMTPAQSCAKEIADGLMLEDWFGRDGNAARLCDEFAADLAPILERLLSSEVARVHEEYQKLVPKWREKGAELDRIHQRNSYAGCANQVEALAPNKEGQK